MMLKKLSPRSLFGRFLLIITIPVVLIQLVTIYIFYERHWNNVTKHMASYLSEDIGLIIDFFEANKDINSQDFEIIKDNLNFEILLLNKDEELISDYKKVRIERLHELLDQQITYPYDIKLVNDKSDINIRIYLKDKDLSITTTAKRIYNPTTSIFLLWIICTAIVLLIISIAISRNQIETISQLAKAAENFGKGRVIQNFKPKGAIEVRKAANAFIQMQDRINRFIMQRTKMLAGISHDLRTPLTRMKLQVEMLNAESEAIAEFKNDIKAMESMIDSYLTFARDDYQENYSNVIISDLINNLKKKYLNKKVEFYLKNDGDILLRANSIERALSNLINNGLQYADQVIVSAEYDINNLIFTIDDDGPGIKPENYDNVFKPFFRQDDSRHIEDCEGNVGLGLAIVKDIVNSHGGEIHINKSQIGGLNVTIIIPIFCE